MSIARRGAIAAADAGVVGGGGGGGGGLLPFSDSFTRADSSTAPGGSWVNAIGVSGIASNQLLGESPGVTSDSDTAHTDVAVVDVGSADVDVTYTAVIPGAGAQAEFLVACSADGTDCINCLIGSDGTSCYIWERMTGVGFGSTDHTDGSLASNVHGTTVTCRIVKNGNNVDFYVNGSLRLTRRLTNAHVGTYIGTRINFDAGGSPGSLRFDDVSAVALTHFDDFTSESAGTLSGQNGWVEASPTGSGTQVASSGHVGGSSTGNYGTPLRDVGKNLGLKVGVHFDGLDPYAGVVFGSNASGTNRTVVILDNVDAGYVQQVVGGVAGPTRALVGGSTLGSTTGVMEVTVSATGLVSVTFNGNDHGSYQLTSGELAALGGNYAGFGAYHQDIVDFYTEDA